MSNTPNPELIDAENPEWTEAMLSEAKTAAQLFPHLIRPASIQKVATTIEYDADIISAFRKTGNNWQARMVAGTHSLVGNDKPVTHPT